MCVSVIYSYCNWHFRTITCFCILIFSITTGFLKNIFSFNMMFNFIIFRICWLCNVLKITSGFLIIFIRNRRSLYFFIHCYNICITCFNILIGFFILFLRNHTHFYLFTHSSYIYRSFYCLLFCGYSSFCLIFLLFL